MTLRFGFHGGKCCGIKSIHGFGWGQNPMSLDEDALEEVDKIWPDERGEDVSSTMRFFHLEAPSETTLERLDRYLEYYRESYRGVIEVTLVDDPCFGEKNEWGDFAYDDGQNAWFEVLEDRGFKLVTFFENGNTRNFIRVYHLVVA